jgi:2-amino-4-hydroxy-6-hydroxymethyldihydropteridine diphosphokinase
LATQTAYIALGSNLDEPVRQLRAGLAALAAVPGVRLVRVSSLYRSAAVAAVGYRNQPDFVNAVAQVETTLEPGELLGALLEVERRQGRVRAFRNAPRTLDLDILLYGNRRVDDPGLTIPHPRMHERAFVIVPLAEIAPDAFVPGHGRAQDLLAGVAQDSVTCLTERAP